MPATPTNPEPDRERLPDPARPYIFAGTVLGFLALAFGGGGLLWTDWERMGLGEGLTLLVTAIAAVLFVLALHVQQIEIRANVAEVKRMAGEMQLDRLGQEIASFCERWNALRGRIYVAEYNILAYTADPTGVVGRRQITNSYIQGGMVRDAEPGLLPLQRVVQGMLRRRAKRAATFAGIHDGSGDPIDIGDLTEIGTLCAELGQLGPAIEQHYLTERARDENRAEEIGRLTDRLALTVISERDALDRMASAVGTYGATGGHEAVLTALQDAVGAIDTLNAQVVERSLRRVT